MFFYFLSQLPNGSIKWTCLGEGLPFRKWPVYGNTFPSAPTPPQQREPVVQFWSVCADQTRRCNLLITFNLKSKSKNYVLCKRDLPSSVCFRAKIHPYPYHSKSYMRNKIDLEKLHSNLSIRISTKCTIQFAQSFSIFNLK